MKKNRLAPVLIVVMLSLTMLSCVSVRRYGYWDSKGWHPLRQFPIPSTEDMST